MKGYPRKRQGAFRLKKSQSLATLQLGTAVLYREIELLRYLAHIMSNESRYLRATQHLDLWQERGQFLILSGHDKGMYLSNCVVATRILQDLGVQHFGG